MNQHIKYMVLINAIVSCSLFSLQTSVYAAGGTKDDALKKDLIQAVQDGSVKDIRKLLDNSTGAQTITNIISIINTTRVTKKGAKNYNKALLEVALANEAVLSCLLELNGNPNWPCDVDQNTPLGIELKKGSPSLGVIELLIANGANPLKQNQKGETALDFAKKKSNKDELMKALGLPDEDDDDDTPKKGGYGKIILGGVGGSLVLIAMVGGGVYAWRQSVVQKREAQLLSLIAQKKSGAITQTQLDSQYNALQDGLWSWEVASLNQFYTQHNAATS